MDLTLGLDESSADRMGRLPALKTARQGRPRAQPVRIIWHDTLDRTLAEQGLALAEQRGHWRLERHRPVPDPVHPWAPATDHRLISEAASLDALALELDGPAVAMAAFEGRRTVSALLIDGETVTMTVLRGVLRAVAAEEPATRLHLEGPDAAVTTLVRTLGELLPLFVPLESLATRALRLGAGGPPPPRRAGPPALSDGGFSAFTAFAHILGHLTDTMLFLAPAVADASSGPEPVHQIRVAVRRARSALTVFRDAIDHPHFQTVEQGLRAFGKVLGPAREWDVFMTETMPPVDATLPGRPDLKRLARAGARRRIAARAALVSWLDSPAFRIMTLDLACLAASAPPPPPATDAEADLVAPPPLETFAATILRARWRKLRRPGKRLSGLEDAALHDQRLRAKRLRYAAEFFAPLYPDKATRRFIRRLAALQEYLGIFNDTATAETLLRELNPRPGHAAGLILGFTAAHGANIRPRIERAWKRFRECDPFWE